MLYLRPRTQVVLDDQDGQDDQLSLNPSRLRLPVWMQRTSPGEDEAMLPGQAPPRGE